MRTCLVMVLVLSVVLGPSRGSPEDEPARRPAGFAKGMTVSEVVAYALQHNPEIQAAQRRGEALRARIPQAGALDDPVLGVGAMNLPTNTFRFNQVDMTMKQLTLSQKFPFPGKLRLQAEIASYEAEIGAEDIHEVENRVISQVKQAFYDLYFIDRATAITERNKTLLAEFVKIADSKYRVGTGIQQDVILAQVEQSKIFDQLIQLEQQRGSAAIRLNTLLNLPPESPVGQTLGVTHVPLSQGLAALKEEALARRPQLRPWHKRSPGVRPPTAWLSSNTIPISPSPLPTASATGGDARTLSPPRP